MENLGSFETKCQMFALCSDRFKHIDEQVVPRTDWELDTPAVSSLCCGSGDPGSVERAHAGNALLGCPSPAILC